MEQTRPLFEGRPCSPFYSYSTIVLAKRVPRAKREGSREKINERERATAKRKIKKKDHCWALL